MKRIVGIVIIIILLAAIAGAVLLFNGGLGGQQSGKRVVLNNFIPVDACSVLTEDAAKAMLGGKVTKASAPATSGSSATIAISTCSYISNPPAAGTSTTPKSSGAWLIVRTAKTADGAASNKSQFESEKPADVQAVDGLGDSAFYNPQFRQLNVLKGNNWYVITAYKDSILNSSLESNKQLARMLTFR